MILGFNFNVNLLSVAAQSNTYMDILMSRSLYPTMFSNTRPYSSSSLDNIFLSWETSFDSYVLSYDISDHVPIILRLIEHPAPNGKLML